MRSSSCAVPRTADGGFGEYDGRSSNGQSTAYAVQGLVAAGRNPAGSARAAVRRRVPPRASERANGSVDYSRVSSQTPVWVTAQAAIAFGSQAIPLRGGAARARQAHGCRPGRWALDGVQPQACSGTGAAQEKAEGKGWRQAEEDCQPEAPVADSGWTAYGAGRRAADELPRAPRPETRDPPGWGALTLVAAASAFFWGPASGPRTSREEKGDDA